MKRLVLYSIFLLLCLSSCKRCKKEKKMITLTGTIYKDCDSLARNATYQTRYLYRTKGNIKEITTDYNGRFSFQLEKYDDDAFAVFPANNPPNEFTNLGGGYGEDHDFGIIREVYHGYVVIKLKTQQGLAAGNTLNYVLQFSNTTTTIQGPITKDTIITTLVYGLNNSWENPDQSDNKTLWWKLNKQPLTGTSDENQLDYRVHGCNINNKDTAYIVIP